MIHDSDTERFLSIGGNVVYSLDCEDDAYKAVQDFLGKVGTNAPQTEQDSAFAKLAELKPCSLASTQTESKKPGNGKPNPSKSGKDLKKEADEKAAKERAEQQLKADELRAAAAGHAPTTPDCAPSCALEDYTGPISEYATDVQAIVTGKSVSDVEDGLKKGNGAIDGLLTAVKANPLASAAVDAVNAIGDLALQEAQYEALKSLVFNFDQSRLLFEPAVVKAARVRYALLVYTRAAASMEAALTAQEFVNDPANYRDVAERLALFEYFNVKVNTASEAFSDTVKVDPEKAFEAVDEANHALALALLDPKRQLASLGDAIKSLSDQASALKKAASPPAKK